MYIKCVGGHAVGFLALFHQLSVTVHFQPHRCIHVKPLLENSKENESLFYSKTYIAFIYFSHARTHTHTHTHTHKSMGLYKTPDYISITMKPFNGGK